MGDQLHGDDETDRRYFPSRSTGTHSDPLDHDTARELHARILLDVKALRGRVIPALTGTALRMGGGFLLGNLASALLGLSHLDPAVVL